MTKSILLSPEHGVNVTLMQCRLCAKETGVAMLGRLKGDAKAPRSIPDQEPCKECAELLAAGFLFVEAEKFSGGTTLTGRKWVIKRDVAEKMLLADVFARGACYIDAATAKGFGFPYDEVTNEND